MRPSAEELRSRLSIHVRDADLGSRLGDAVETALRTALGDEPPPVASVAVTGARDVATVPPGAIACLTVTAANIRSLGRLVRSLEERAVAGIQLVWNGVEPPRSVAEPAVFALLERRRDGVGVPLVLSASREPSWVLLRAIPPSARPKGASRAGEA